MSHEIVQTPANEADTKAAIFSPSGLQKLQAFAAVMAEGKATVPKHLSGNTADCLAIALQAAQWGMNPYAVAQKTHLVNGTLGYEAQLVNAVITSSTAVQGRFKYEYSGNWDTFRPGDKDSNAEKGLCVRVGAVLRGEAEITWGEWLHLEFITIRNSPLWKTAPKQQIAYLAVKYWARLFCPDVILGVYTPDEFEPEKQRTERDITPVRSAGDLNNLINQKPGKQANTVQQSVDERSPEEILEAFKDAATKAASPAELDKAYRYAARALAGTQELLDVATDIYGLRTEELSGAAA